MVDTPTTRNRFRKQETGTNVNTWGDNLDEALDAIDQALDGVETIDLGGAATYTLTTTNYTTADQAKNRVLVFINANASGTTVTIPSVEHEYGVFNDGGGNVVVKTAAGAGVAIPDAYFCRVYCDGVDVLAQATFFNGVVRGSAAVGNSEFTTLNQVSQLIAAAAISGTGNTFKISATDTTSKYAEDAIVGEGSITVTKRNPGANEYLGIGFTFDEGQAALTAGVLAL